MAKYYVYVIELDSEVANLKKVRVKNPRYVKGNGCFYVGQSTRPPELRFEQHKEGYKSNKYAKYYGKKLRPDIYKKYNRGEIVLEEPPAVLEFTRRYQNALKLNVML